MLELKSHLVTAKILAQINTETTIFDTVLIRPIILKALEEVYIQARQDQINKVVFDLRPDGSIIFPS